MTRKLAALLLGFIIPFANADAIVTDSGDYVEAPAGQKAVFVPKDSPEVLIAIEGIKLTTPVATTPRAPAPTCTPKGELTTGGPPCEE